MEKKCERKRQRERVGRIHVHVHVPSLVGFSIFSCLGWFLSGSGGTESSTPFTILLFRTLGCCEDLRRGEAESGGVEGGEGTAEFWSVLFLLACCTYGTGGDGDIDDCGLPGFGATGGLLVAMS